MVSSVIFIFGPSCSGKSSLGQALAKNLGTSWNYIDRDDLIEKGLCTDAEANSLLDAQIQKIGTKIIVDAQVPWRACKKDEFYFRILPPLEVLLARDQARTQLLKRSDKAAFYAKSYVIETFQILSSSSESFHLTFDSSKESLEDEIQKIKKIVKPFPKHSFKILAGLAVFTACFLIFRKVKS